MLASPAVGSSTATPCYLQPAASRSAHAPPLAQHLPAAQSRSAHTPQTADQLTRNVPGLRPPMQVGGPTLGQVAGLCGSSWQPARETTPRQSHPRTTQAGTPGRLTSCSSIQSPWAHQPGAIGSTAIPQAPGASQATPTKPVVPGVAFDWLASPALDLLSKTAPSLPTPRLGMDWLSSSLAAFQVPAVEELGPKASDPSTNMVPFPAASPVASMPAPPPPRPVREGCHLRFNTGTSSRQHPLKQAVGIPNADATEESPMLLGICDGVSGCTKLGISPDLLPHELLAACRSKGKHYATEAASMAADDGHWLVDLMKDAFDSTMSMGATTMLLASIHDSGSLVTANIGDCSLLVLRVVKASGSTAAHLQPIFKTKATRYEASKPVQVQRLPHMSEERTHNVITNSKLEVCPVQSGDYVVIGSDGLFDNLQDDDIQEIVERVCPMGRAASTAVLTEAAAALVSDAISHAGPATKDAQCGNPDDTTALVATVVEVPDVDEYERWFWRSRGIPQPNYNSAESNGAAAARGQMSARAAGPAKVPQTDGQMRARSLEPAPNRPSPAELASRQQRQRSIEPPQAPPLQDRTNTPANTAFRAGPNACQQAPSPQGKGKGKGTTQLAPDSAGDSPAAPGWWGKMAVPGKAAEPVQHPPPVQRPPPQGATGQPATQAERDWADDHQPRLTSTILRSHEAKIAMSDSIARYGNTNVNRDARLSHPGPRGWRPPPIPERRTASAGDDANCTIS